MKLWSLKARKMELGRAASESKAETVIWFTRCSQTSSSPRRLTFFASSSLLPLFTTETATLVLCLLNPRTMYLACSIPTILIHAVTCIFVEAHTLVFAEFLFSNFATATVVAWFINEHTPSDAYCCSMSYLSSTSAERAMSRIQQLFESIKESPSIYEPTPEEHVEHYWSQIDEGREKMRAWKAPGFCMIVPPPPTP